MLKHSRNNLKRIQNSVTICWEQTYFKWSHQKYQPMSRAIKSLNGFLSLIMQLKLQSRFPGSKRIEMFHKGEWICMHGTWNNNNHQVESHTDVYSILFSNQKYILGWLSILYNQFTCLQKILKILTHLPTYSLKCQHYSEAFSIFVYNIAKPQPQFRKSTMVRFMLLQLAAWVPEC